MTKSTTQLASQWTPQLFLPQGTANELRFSQSRSWEKMHDLEDKRFTHCQSPERMSQTVRCTRQNGQVPAESGRNQRDPLTSCSRSRPGEDPQTATLERSVALAWSSAPLRCPAPGRGSRAPRTCARVQPETETVGEPRGTLTTRCPPPFPPPCVFASRKTDTTLRRHLLLFHK